MLEQFSRTRMLLGEKAMERLAASRVAIFGIGGVGGYVAEALARSGVGAIDLVDNDKVCISNINRQIIATRKSVGRYKVDVMEERILDINPDCTVKTHKCFYLPETKDSFDFREYDYVVDAVDTVTAKLALVMQANEAGTGIISCMGAGNKLEPSAFEVSDIYKTSIVYSKEEAIKPSGDAFLAGADITPAGRRAIPASIAFVPAVAGLIIAGEVVKDLIKD